MAPATEIATLPMKAGGKFDDASTDEGRIWQDILRTILDQPGSQRAYWGREVGNPGNCKLFIDWDSHDAHKKFMGSGQFKHFAEKVGTIMDGAPDLYHANLDPHPATAAMQTAQTTEVLALLFPTDLSDSDKSTIESNIKKFIETMPPAGESGYYGAARGWAIEQVPCEKAKDGKAIAYQGVIGWQSVEAHMKYRETQAFKDNIHLLREVPQLLGLSVYHVNFQMTEA